MSEIKGNPFSHWQSPRRILVHKRRSFDLDTAAIVAAHRKSRFSLAGPGPFSLFRREIYQKELRRASRMTRALRLRETPAPAVITLITESLGFFINTASLLFFFILFYNRSTRFFSNSHTKDKCRQFYGKF